jgi:hypothetical protein
MPWLLYPPGWTAPNANWIGGWVDSRAGLDVVENRKFSCSCQESNSSHPACSLSLYQMSYPVSPKLHRWWKLQKWLRLWNHVHTAPNIKIEDMTWCLISAITHLMGQWQKSMEQWWNDNKHSKTKEIWRNNCSSATFSTINVISSHPVLNLRLQSEMWAPNCLSHEMAMILH